MIIPHQKRLTDAELALVESIVGEFGCRIQPIVGAHRTIYAILGDERQELMFNRLIGLDFVDRVDHIESPYKLLDRQSELAGHRITLGGLEVGSEPLIIAGPCTVDPANPQLTLETAHAVREAGAHVLRGGVWKPRTMPYSYQGEDRALEILLEASRETGLPLDIEVMESRHLDLVLEAGVRMIQVGTRNALNYSLLKEIGRRTAETPAVVLLKRARSMGPVDEFLAAAEYIVAAGNADVILCPRGTMPALDGYRNHPDESVCQLLKEQSWAPVVFDPSHAVGRAAYVPACALAAIAYGADGLCVEAHVDPRRGIGDDPKQAVTPEVLKAIISDVRLLFGLETAFRASRGIQ